MPASLLSPSDTVDRFDPADHCHLCGGLLDYAGRCPLADEHDMDLYGPDDLHDWSDV